VATPPPGLEPKLWDGLVDGLSDYAAEVIAALTGRRAVEV
jgi:hypothetical protein